MRRLLPLVAFVLAVITLAGCFPKPIPKPVPHPPSIDREMIVGDSLTVQSSFYGGICFYGNIDDACRHTADMLLTVGLGWEAEDALPGVQAAVVNPERSPARARIELGFNDSAPTSLGGDNFTPQDMNQLFQLVTAFDKETCVILILPHYSGTNVARYLGIEAYRNWAVRMYNLRDSLDRHIVMVDWREHVSSGDLGVDGAHLNVSTPGPPQKFADMMMTTGEEACAND